MANPRGVFSKWNGEVKTAGKREVQPALESEIQQRAKGSNAPGRDPEAASTQIPDFKPFKGSLLQDLSPPSPLWG